MKVYLAGPDVFRSDAAAKSWFDSLKKSLAERGHVGLSPFDSEAKIDPNKSKAEQALDIFLANCKLIEECHAVLANISPFRGPSCDAGTAWEIGYATAKGKPTFAYTYDNLGPSYKYRCERMEECGIRIKTPEYPKVEDFGLGDNLMIECSVNSIAADAEQAIIWLERYVRGR